MLWIRMLTMFTLLTVIVTALAACGGAPAPQSSGATTAPAASSAAPTAETAPTTAPAPTAALAATATSAPLVDTNPTKPDDKTQGRLRMSNCIMGSPSVDVFVNSKLAVNGGRQQTNLGALDTSTYLYLEPDTYSVALVPTGEGVDKALLGPLDVSIAAGHRYTVVAMGQLSDTSHKPLVIDETAAFQEIGASPTDSVQVTVNNLKGVPGIDWSLDGAKRASNVPYGGFKAGIWPAAFTGDFVTVSAAPDKVLVKEEETHFFGPGLQLFACWGGTYPGSIGADYDNHLAGQTSALNAVEYLQLLTDTSAKNGGKSPSFATFLTALKTTGMADMLTTGGPYLIFAPQDTAFAALPKGQLDALMADSKALTELLSNHIVEGYYPYGSLSATPGQPGPGRTLTNLLGKPLKLLNTTINGQEMGHNGNIEVMSANGTRINPVNRLLLPDAK